MKQSVQGKKLGKSFGLIGCGNMGNAILAGLLTKGIVSSNQIFVFDSDGVKVRSAARKFRIKAARNNADLVRLVDVILLAVKPQDLKMVGNEIRAELTPRQTVISILAGTPIQKMRRALGSRVMVVRAMPNLGAQVGDAVTAITSSDRSALRIAELIFSGCGRVVKLSECYFDLVTAVSGSGPAYFFLMMELLCQVAEKEGLSKKTAEALAIGTALGAARLAQVSRYSPVRLRKMVTSKKGTTEAALRYFAKKGFSRIFIDGVRKAILRARELSRN